MDRRKEGTDMKKILFLTNIPSPYRGMFFNELGKTVDLTVIYERGNASNRNKKWEKVEQENYKAIYLKGINLFAEMAFCPSVLRYIEKKYDLIILSDYSTPTEMLAIIYMHIKKIPFVLSADGGMAKNDSKLKRWLKKFFISKARAWLSSGDVTTQYLAYYGADISKIYKYPFTSITDKDIIDRVSDSDRKLIRNKLGIKEQKMILSVGSYIPRKGYDILIKAMQYIPEDVGVCIVGGKPGHEYIELKERYRLNNLYFVDFMRKKDLKEYYRAADIFVLPTREDIWGLVINEAMACGLPIITTDKCVAGLELVQDYQNGFIVPVDNPEQLGDKISLLLKDEELCKKMSDNNLELIRNYTISKMSERHLQVLDYITD